VTDKPAPDDKPDKASAPDKTAATPQVKSGTKEDTPPDTVTSEHGKSAPPQPDLDPQPDPKGDAPNPGPPDDPYGQAMLLRAQATAIEAAAADAGHVRLKVGPPHSLFSYGGVDVGPDWTAVHSSLAPGVLRAAEEAGVTVTQEG
jgi:hypothetical protein